jgi:tape measure domain-containing protein
MIAGSIEIALLANVARLQQDMDKANRVVGTAMQRIDRSVETAKRALGGLVGAFGVRELVRALDEYTKLTAQLKIATRSSQEFAAAYSNVIGIARRSQSDISAVATLYARLSTSLQSMGASQAQVSSISETVALALRVNGATAQETASAMLQLSQAFGSGRLQGEEFRAMMESAPGLMRQLAKSIDQPVGSLKQLATDGKLTADVLARAFTDPEYLNGLRQQVKEVSTISSAITVLKNNLTVLLGEMDKATGGSKGVADMFLWVADNIAVLADVVNAAIGVFVQFGKSLAVVFKDIETANKVAFLSSSPITALIYRDDIKKALEERNKFVEAANEDLQNFLQMDVYKFRNALKIAREEAATPFEGKPFNQISEATKGAAKSVLTLAEALKRFADEDEEYRAKQIDGAKEQIALENRIREQQSDAIESLSREVAGWSELSEVQRTSWEIQTGRYKDFDRESKDELLRLAQLIDARQELKQLEKSVEQLEKENQARASASQEESADKVTDAWKKSADEQANIWDSIEKTAHDTFVSIFDSGKSAFDRLKDTLKNGLLDLLYQMTLKKWILNIGAAVTGGASGSAMAGLLPGEVGGIPTGSGSGIGLGSIKSVFDVVTKGFEAANNLFLSGIQDFGVSVANLGGVFTDVGSWITMNGSTIAAVAPFVPSIISILSGDIKGGIASGIGAGIGMAIGGPVGGAIGSALGSLVGGLFGGDKPKMYGAQSQSSYNGGALVRSTAGNFGHPLGGDANKSIRSLTDGFVSTLGNFLKAFGVNSHVTGDAVFRKRTTVRAGFWGTIDGKDLFYGKKYGDNADMQKSFNDFVNQVMGPLMAEAIRKSKLSDGIKMLFSGMTDKTQVINMMNATLSLNAAQEQLAERFGLTVDQSGRVSKATGLAGDDLIKFVNSLASAALSFKTSGEVLIEARDALTASFSDSGGGSSLPGTLKAFDDILKGIDKTAKAGIQQFADLFAIREQFSQYTQAIDSLKGGVKGALFGIVSPGEQQAMMQADLAELFGSLNLQIPGSVQELINLGKSIDYTTEEGLNLAAAFPSLVAAFQQTREQVDALTESLLDVNRFATLVDYTRAQRYASSGIDVSSLPSYDVGTAFVPADGPAMIHQGERIMTRSENSAMVGAVQANAAAIARLEQKIEAGLYAVATNTGETARRIRKWDGDGMPETRTITA